MVDAGESKIYMSTRDTLIPRLHDAAPSLSLAAVFCRPHRSPGGSALIGSSCSRGLCVLYLLASIC